MTYFNPDLKITTVCKLIFIWDSQASRLYLSNWWRGITKPREMRLVCSMSCKCDEMPVFCLTCVGGNGSIVADSSACVGDNGPSVADSLACAGGNGSIVADSLSRVGGNWSIVADSSACVLCRWQLAYVAISLAKVIHILTGNIAKRWETGQALLFIYLSFISYSQYK